MFTCAKPLSICMTITAEGLNHEKGGINNVNMLITKRLAIMMDLLPNLSPSILAGINVVICPMKKLPKIYP